MVQSLDKKHLMALTEQLTQLTVRCKQWDKKITLSENKSFRFEIHLFSADSLTLEGYAVQIAHTLAQLHYALEKEMPRIVINLECEKFLNQFSALLKIINSLDVGNAETLYKRYSSQQETVYQNLQRQYQYEKRLLTMIDDENILYQNATTFEKNNHKARIRALKERYQKCNAYTQFLEFKMEALDNG